MKDKNGKKSRGKPRRDSRDIGVVRVFSNPGPDAEDRLRRLTSLLVRYATRDGQAAPEKDSPSDASPGELRDEAEG